MYKHIINISGRLINCETHDITIFSIIYWFIGVQW